MIATDILSYGLVLERDSVSSMWVSETISAAVVPNTETNLLPRQRCSEVPASALRSDLGATLFKDRFRQHTPAFAQAEICWGDESLRILVSMRDQTCCMIQDDTCVGSSATDAAVDRGRSQDGKCP